MCYILPVVDGDHEETKMNATKDPAVILYDDGSVLGAEVCYEGEDAARRIAVDQPQFRNAARIEPVRAGRANARSRAGDKRAAIREQEIRHAIS